MALVSKKYNFYVWVFCIALGVIIYMQTLGPKPIDWKYSFSKEDKIPYGNSILFELLPALVPKSEIVTSYSSLYSSSIITSGEKNNLIVINNDFLPDELDFNFLLEYLAAGGSAFIACGELSEQMADTFQLELSSHIPFHGFEQDSVIMNFANRKLKTPWGYTYKKAIASRHFASYDSLRTTVLGINGAGKTNFIKISWGAGELFLNCNPMAFCNYNILMANNNEYIFKCLSYLPVQTTIWDEYYKAKPKPSQSQLRYIFSQTSLKYAWYLFLLGVFVFFIFESKRRQRAIPVVNPPVNTSYKFIETIGHLYYGRKHHKDIAIKKYTYFKEFVRSRYYIDTSEMNKKAVDVIQVKSGVQEKNLNYLINMAERLQKAECVSADELELFNRKVEYFYNHCN